jgi:predicted dehydrogenase
VPDVYTDLEEMLDSNALDAVIVATPNHLHEPHILACLRKGLHVLSERPMALTVRGLERCLAAATKKDCVLQVANNHRFRSDVQALTQFLHNGELGALTAVRAGSLLVARPGDGWRGRKAEAGGGVFLDQGFPLLDLALWLADFPEPVRLSAHARKGKGANATEVAMQLLLECVGGVSIMINVSWAYVGEGDRWWFEVHGDKGSGRLAPLRVVKDFNGRHINVTPTGAAGRESPFLQSYRAELAHFVAMVQGDVPRKLPKEQLLVHRVLDAAYKAAEDGREVRF